MYVCMYGRDRGPRRRRRLESLQVILLSLFVALEPRGGWNTSLRAFNTSPNRTTPSSGIVLCVSVIALCLSEIVLCFPVVVLCLSVMVLGLSGIVFCLDVTQSRPL